jgi:lysophospholipase L1-like esterase
MDRTTVMSRIVWLIAPALLTATLVAAPAAAAVATADDIDYVSLGDSYAAGLGTPKAVGWCARSPQAHPQLWAKAHGASLTAVACSGATGADVLAGQVSTLSAATDRVSITVGGNDSGFAPTVVTCVLATDSGCTAAVRKARTFITGTLPGRLDTVYAAIRDRAPAARVVVLAYPRLFDTAGACPGGMSRAKRRVLNAAADDLAEVVRDRARAAGFVFADVRAAFDGHGICARTPWVNALSVLRPADSFHPNAAGHAQGYLPALNAAL